MPEFKDICRRGKCQICGKEADVAVFSSTMGASAFSYCEDCAKNGYEPYSEMVAYIASAGHWPNDINETYQNIVRHNLKFHNKTEAEFAYDVDHCFDGLLEYIESLKKEAGYDNEYDRFW